MYNQTHNFAAGEKHETSLRLAVYDLLSFLFAIVGGKSMPSLFFYKIYFSELNILA